MNKLLLLFFPLLGWATCRTHAQPPNFTANDVVQTFSGDFGFGVNLGYYPPHYYDENLAILAHGSPDGKVPGAGVTCIRPGLFDHFLDYWGYDIRKSAFLLYDSIGLKDNVVFVGYPAPRHRDSTKYCTEHMSELFKNLYEPIWDNGKNGTPVNDDNYYALYLWKMVSVYKNQVKFWEIWNEPDLDMSGNAWKPATISGNWWTRTPDPCEMAIRAPIFHYIRMLRISYEVIKTIDPFAYVAIGGIGYTSFLDVVLRHTDNPNGGVVSAKFPLKGGAYFDCLSYHSYPHIESAMREWSNNINNFVYFRHSDAAVNGVIQKKLDMQAVLEKYGYDGKIYPRKEWIITELNLPRKQFHEFIGSEDAQVNFIIKTAVLAQQHNIRQIYIYSLADHKPLADAGTDEFAFMGLFENLTNIQPFEGKRHRLADAYKTLSDLLHQSVFDDNRTAALQLPAGVRGGAFRNKKGEFTYVLWAVTDTDRSEICTANYVFPENLGIKYLEKQFWHSSKSGAKQLVNARQVRLDGEPIFLKETLVSETTYPKSPKMLPNPVLNAFSTLSFWVFDEAAVTIEMFDAKGRLVQKIMTGETLPKGAHQILVDWTHFGAGTYFIRVTQGEEQTILPVVKL